MKKRKPAAKEDEFLVNVARSIGSTLGAVAAKVNPSSHKRRPRPVRRKRAPKQSSISRNHRRASATASKRSSPAATLKRRNRKWSGK
jgi:hypothetical protein